MVWTVTATHETGDFTPAQTNFAVGTGGGATNTAKYTWLGGPEVGEYGNLTIAGIIVFGTSGVTLPSDPRIGLPPGFEWVFANNMPLGHALCTDSGTSANSRYATVTALNTTTIRPIVGGGIEQNGAFILNTISTTSGRPFTWAAGDSIVYHCSGIAVRV